MFSRVPNLPKIWWKQIKIHISIGIYNENVNLGPGCSLVFQIFLNFDESKLKITFPSVFTMKMWILVHRFFLISPVFFQITFSSQIFFRLLFQVRFFSDFFSDYFFKSDFFSDFFSDCFFKSDFFSDFFSDYFFKSDFFQIFFSDCFFKSDFFSHSKSDFFQKLIISRIWAYGWWWTLLYYCLNRNKYIHI